MKVLKKQFNSKMCFVCGVENKFGLKALFYEMEDESVVSIFEYKNDHQSYPDRTHGGIIATILDEIIGRAIWIFEPSIWGVTIELNVKYRKPVLLNTTLYAKGIIKENKSKTFVGEGFLYDSTGVLLANATATYLKISTEKFVLNHDEVNIIVDDNVLDIKMI